jgi:Flp pilus assembly protein TadG
MIRRLFRCKRGTAAVEAAIFAPIYLAMTLGITDLGSGMFVGMQVNAAAQVGAAYAVINSSGVCSSMTASCLSGIKQAMNDATGDPSFCTGSVCTASFTSCAEANGGICYTVSVHYPHNPILPDAAYTWAQPAQTYSSTATVRVPTP